MDDPGDKDRRWQRPAAAEVAEQDEAALIARLRAGDDRAFELLVREQSGWMLAVARRMLHSESDAADVLQDAFLLAFHGLASFRGEARVRTWLHRIVVNAALMKLRSQKNRRTVSIEQLLPSFDRTGHHTRRVTKWSAQPDDPLVSAELQAQVRACIDRLPDDYREILLLRDMEQLATEQTAELLALSTAAVKTRLHRARQALRTMLDPIVNERGEG